MDKKQSKTELLNNELKAALLNFGRSENPVGCAINSGKEAEVYRGKIDKKGYRFIGLTQTKESRNIGWRFFYGREHKVFSHGETSKKRALNEIKKRWHLNSKTELPIKITEEEVTLYKTYGVSSIPYAYNGRVVEMGVEKTKKLKNKTFVVYKTDSGWLLSALNENNTVAATYGGEIAGIGRIGYATPEEAVVGGYKDIKERIL